MENNACLTNVAKRKSTASYIQTNAFQHNIVPDTGPHHQSSMASKYAVAPIVALENVLKFIYTSQ